MSDYDALSEDWDQTVEGIRQRGLLASLYRYSALSGVFVGAVAINYGGPELTNAIASIIEADMSLVDGPARAAYGEALTRSMNSLSTDVMAMADWIWSPVEENWAHFKAGTLLEHHKDWVSDLKIAEIPVGEAVTDTLSWALSSNQDASTLVGKHLRPAIGVAVIAGITVLAGRAAISVTGKSLNAMADTWSKGRDLVRDIKSHAGKLLDFVKFGVQKGINAALGKEMPSHLVNPFATPEVKEEKLDLKKELTDVLVKTGADKDVAKTIVTDLVSRISDGEKKIAQLTEEKIDLADHVAQLRRDISDLGKRLSDAEDPARIRQIVEQSLRAPDAEDHIIIHKADDDTPFLH
jgi:chorismate mutase